MSEDWRTDASNSYWARAGNWLVRQVSEGVFGIFRSGKPLTDDDGKPVTRDSPSAAMDHVDNNYPS